MGILRATKYKTFLKLSAAVFLLSTFIVANLMPLSASAAVSTGDGKIKVTLSQNPSSAATVTAKRAADAITPEGKSIPAETVKLTLVTGASGKYQVYQSSVLAYSGYSNNPAAGGGGCRDEGETYYDWNVIVSGSATGSAKVRVACGGTVSKTITVTLAGKKATTGIISGTAIYQTWNCNSNSVYQLLAPGVTSDFSNNAGLPLQIDGTTGKYSITSKPGTYNLYVDCLYNPNGANIPSEEVLTQLNVVVTAGSTNTINLNQTSIASATETPSCESTGVTLAWIVCPIITGLSNAVDGIYNNVITPMLQLDTEQSSDTWKQTKTAWSNFRIYADIFLVIALLVIVFGQTIGGGLIDAYSAKKILPRLLLSAVLINLSYYLVVLLIDITNIVGGGLVSLIAAPFGFSGPDALQLTSNAGTSVVVIGGITALVTASIVGGTAFIGFLWPFILLPALLTFIAIFVTVLVRRGLIILLIIISPVAFALYCLPNTEKYFRQWWDMLFRALLVYPIIAALFALSKIMSVTIVAGGTSSGIAASTSQIIAIIALLVPLFLIPFAFKIAGGIIGQASQAFNGLSKQAHKKMLGDSRDPNSMGAKAKNKLGTRYASKNLSGEAIGARLKPNRWVNKRGRAAISADLDTIRNKQLASYAKKGASTEWAELNSQDSNVLKDLATYKTGAESKEAAYEWARNRPAELDKDLAAGKITADERDRKLAAIPNDLKQKLYSSATADRIGRNEASRRRALLSAPTIGYEIGSGEAGWNEATAIMKDIAGGQDNGTYRAMVNEFQYIAKNSGRTDLAGATNGEPYSGLKARNIANPYQLATTEKASSIKSHAKYTLDKYLSGSNEDKIGAATWYQEISTAYNNATGENRDALFDAMRLLEDANIQNFMNMTTGSGNKIKQIVPDPADANKKIYVDRDETISDVAARKARAYQPPDPNKITT